MKLTILLYGTNPDMFTSIYGYILSKEEPPQEVIAAVSSYDEVHVLSVDSNPEHIRHAIISLNAGGYVYDAIMQIRGTWVKLLEESLMDKAIKLSSINNLPPDAVPVLVLTNKCKNPKMYMCTSTCPCVSCLMGTMVTFNDGITSVDVMPYKEYSEIMNSVIL